MTFLHNAAEALGCILYYVFSVKTLSILFSPRKKHHRAMVIVAGMIYFPLTFPGITILPNLVASFLSMGIVFVISLLCYQGNWKYKLLTVVIYNIFDILVGNVCFYVTSVTTQKTFEDLSVPGSFSRIYLLFIIYLIEYGLLCFLKNRKNPLSIMSAEDSVISALFFGCSFLVVILNYYILYYVADDNLLLNISGFFITCSMLIIQFIAMRLLQQLQIKRQREHEYDILKLEIKQQKEQLQLLQESEQRIRELRHDTRNYFLTYQTLLEDGKTAEVIDSIKKITELYTNSVAAQLCSNPLVNSMLIQKKNVCETNSIPFFVDVSLPNSFQDIEMVVILSNLIDNGIEREKQEPPSNRFLSIQIIPRPNAISVLIKNYISDSVLSDNPELMTTKTDLRNHGIGIPSVKRLLERKNGILRFYETEHTFCAQIYLPSFH
ncbi:MAG: GHKL domain-containing protein [Acetatifactor sp.]